MLFPAQQPTVLSQSSHIPARPSSCRTRARGLEWAAVTRQVPGPDHTHQYTQTERTADSSRENKTMPEDLFQQLSEKQPGSFCQRCTFNTRLLLCSIRTVTQRDNSSVCEQLWLQHSTAFSAPFTRKSGATDTPEQWNHTNTQRHTQSHNTLGAWESFWPL